MKTLLVMRHAKSDWNIDFGADHDRPLNQRGIKAARHMGRLIADLGLIPDLVMSSTAVRARSTADLAMESGDWGSRLTLIPDFYGSEADTVLEIVSGAEVGTLMIVGHQPTWGEVIRRLTGERVEVKTATVAVIDLHISRWSDLASASGYLAALHHPRR